MLTEFDILLTEKSIVARGPGSWSEERVDMLLLLTLRVAREVRPANRSE